MEKSVILLCVLALWIGTVSCERKVILAGCELDMELSCSFVLRADCTIFHNTGNGEGRQTFSDIGFIPACAYGNAPRSSMRLVFKKCSDDAVRRDINIFHCGINTILELSAPENFNLGTLQLDNAEFPSLDFLNFNETTYPLPYHTRNIETLMLIAGKVKELKKEDFRTHRDLKMIGLSGNDISRIKGNVFDYIPKLEEVWFDSNPVEDIEDYSFSSVKNMKHLHFSKARLSEIREHIFSGLDKLLTLSLHGNRITKIHKNAFADMHSLQVLDLSGNGLHTLEDGTFSAFKDNIFSLENNPHFEKGEGITLNLALNRFHCNCQLGWLHEYMLILGYLENSKNNPMRQIVECSSPEHNHGKNFDNMDAPDFTCQEPLYPTMHFAEGHNIHCHSGGDPRPKVTISVEEKRQEMLDENDPRKGHTVLIHDKVMAEYDPIVEEKPHLTNTGVYYGYKILHDEWKVTCTAQNIMKTKTVANTVGQLKRLAVEDAERLVDHDPNSDHIFVHGGEL